MWTHQILTKALLSRYCDKENIEVHTAGTTWAGWLYSPCSHSLTTLHCLSSNGQDTDQPPCDTTITAGDWPTNVIKVDVVLWEKVLHKVLTACPFMWVFTEEEEEERQKDTLPLSLWQFYKRSAGITGSILEIGKPRLKHWSNLLKPQLVKKTKFKFRSPTLKYVCYYFSLKLKSSTQNLH